jgi:ribosomal protein L9
LIFQANTSKTWKMFGWIGEHDIIDRINTDFGIKLEKKHIDMNEGHIKKIWKRDVFIKLSSDSIAKIIIIVE